MSVWLVVTSLLAAVMSILALLLIARGIVTVVRGKCTLCGHFTKEKTARLIGWVFIVAPVVAYVIYAGLYETLEWGRSGAYAREAAIKGITSSSVEAGLLLAAIVGAYVWALSRAKAQEKAEPSPIASAGV